MKISLYRSSSVLLLLSAATALLSTSLVNGQATEPPTSPKTTPLNYTAADGHELTGHLSIPPGTGPFPAVIIIPDWGTSLIVR